MALVLGHYRTARVTAVLAIVPALAWRLQAQLTGSLQSPFGSWAFWFLIDLAPVPALAAFHRVPRRPRAGPGCWRCPRTISWCPGRCWPPS